MANSSSMNFCTKGARGLDESSLAGSVLVKTPGDIPIFVNGFADGHQSLRLRHFEIHYRSQSNVHDAADIVRTLLSLRRIERIQHSDRGTGSLEP